MISVRCHTYISTALETVTLLNSYVLAAYEVLYILLAVQVVGQLSNAPPQDRPNM